MFKEDFRDFKIPQNIYLTSLNYDTGLKSSVGDKNIIIEALKGKDIKNIKEIILFQLMEEIIFVKFGSFINAKF